MRWISFGLALGLACGPETVDQGTTGTTVDSASSTGPASTDDGAGSQTTVIADGSSGVLPGSSTSMGDSSGTADGSSGGSCDPAAPPSCGSYVYECSNGRDDDGDGLVDLDDPECIGPCDDDEETFRTGIPGDSMSCSHDCFFDGNYGIGDDGCRWDVRCDPLDPAADVGCGYDPNACPSPPWPDPRTCLLTCPPLVPNGCDCFGCCIVDVGGTSQAVYIDGYGCSVDALDTCPACTPQLEVCGNPCDPEQCEICFPSTEPPEGCEQAGCVDAMPCSDHCDCEPGGYCLQGCCHPDPSS